MKKSRIKPGHYHAIHQGREFEIERNDTGSRVWRVFEIIEGDHDHLGAYPSLSDATSAIEKGRI